MLGRVNRDLFVQEESLLQHNRVCSNFAHTFEALADSFTSSVVRSGIGDVPTLVEAPTDGTVMLCGDPVITM